MSIEAPKPLDDPRLQGLFSDAISGALAFGAQNTNPPPAGHWLERFWQMGRAALSEAAAPAAEPVALTDEVLRYAMAAMGTGSPMDAEKFRLFWRYAHEALTAAQAVPQTEPAPDYSDMSREALERHAKRMAQALADDKARAFYRKHALGPLAAPSCLCCGQLPEKVAIQHMELPEVVLCEKCRNATWAAPQTEKDAARDVLAERKRQIEAECWTPQHDDEHGNGEMAKAAACYALGSQGWPQRGVNFWPWDASWWKPASNRRNLVKAGALILAEIERLDRAAMATEQPK
jgi:hypothetical protein